MLSGLLGNRSNKNKDFVFETFKSQIESNGMKIDAVDETGLISITKGAIKLKISLDNVRRNYERDNDEIHISDLVQTLISHAFELPTDWTTVKDDIYISLLPNDYDFDNTPFKSISDEFSKVYIYVGQGDFTWVSKNDLATWNVTEADLNDQANNNANNLLKQTEIAFETIEDRKLGRIENGNPALKGALLFATDMNEKVERDFGFPFYTVIPARDFCYIFSEEDFDFFAQRIGKVVVNEYNQSGYPITTEILKFTSEGPEAVGKYPSN